MSKMTLSEELVWRGFVNQTTYKDPSVLDKQPITFYWGVDPSSDSMTIGNLAPAMMVRHFIEHGHKAILLVGGATGLIGDPDGKTAERDLLSAAQIAANKAALAAQYQTIFAGQPFEIVDNYDWFKDIGYLSFLREIGKHVPMRQMLGREFIQSRLSEDGAGISYAEFSYALIQGYDFLHLFRQKQVTLQVCGADQWGNSIAGVELIRRIAGGEAHIWSSPLIVNKATGRKFGKSENGAVWLDPKKTSIYQFYQFWLNVDDAAVSEYLKIYTFLTKEDHHHIMYEFDQDRAGRLAQKTLAYEVTKIVHGPEAADSVQRVSEILFGHGSYSSLTARDFDIIGNELPVITVSAGASLIEVLVSGKLAQSKSDARRFLESNAVYVNGQQIPLSQDSIRAEDVIHGYVIVRRGKNSQVAVKVS
jgi:tyrosyl-tRNA synthetase